MAVGARARFAARAMTGASACAGRRNTLGEPAPARPALSGCGHHSVELGFHGRADHVLVGGGGLTGRAFRQPAGWAFLGLSAALGWGKFQRGVRRAGRRRDDDDYPAGELIAIFGDSSFVWFFVAIALCLQFTATIRPAASRWRLLPWLTIASGAVFQVASLLRSTPTEIQPHVSSPWAIESITPVMNTLALVAVLVLGLCLLASVYVLAVAFRRARGEARQQLLWLVAGATPMAPGVVAAFAVSFAGDDTAAGVPLIVAVIALALGAGFSVAKYRLYDVERVVSESVSYALASGAVIVVFGLVVVVITRSIPDLSSTARWPISVATLAAAGVARPAYVWATLSTGASTGGASTRSRWSAAASVKQASTSRICSARPSAIRAPARVPGAGRWLVDVQRSRCGLVGARWTSCATTVWAPGSSSMRDARRAVSWTQSDTRPPPRSTTWDFAVELARQVEEVTESRARLAGAHLEERQRMERDLHDGAQQRILAIALQLRSARVNGADDALRDEVDRAIADLGPDRAGAARPCRRPPARRPRRWWASRSSRGPSQPDPAPHRRGGRRP